MSSLIDFIITFGYLALFLVVFLESGVVIGFFLPGDSLLFTAGLLAAQGQLNLLWVIVACFLGAIMGVQAGYWFGAKVGKKLYVQENSFWLRKEHLEKTHHYYAKHGRLTIILARFTPIVRTFAPIVAGIGAMPYGQFVTYNIIGGLLWAVGIPLLGYFLGSRVPNIDRYLLPIIGLIVVLSILPAAWHLWRTTRAQP